MEHFWGCGHSASALEVTYRILRRLFINLCFVSLHLFLVGDVSSISGSDSDSSDVSSESELLPSGSDTPQTSQIPRSHKVLLRNAKGQLISMYRCVLITGKASHSPAFGSGTPEKVGGTGV